MKAPARRRSERKLLTNGDFQAVGDLGLAPPLRGGNVTRLPKTSTPPRIAIYLPKGILISKVELSYRGGSVTILVMGLYWVTPGG